MRVEFAGDPERTRALRWVDARTRGRRRGAGAGGDASASASASEEVSIRMARNSGGSVDE